MFNRVYSWIDERLNIRQYIRKEILDKPVLGKLNFSYCFGGITFFLFIVLTFTGLSMAIYYVPSPDHAYDTVDYLTYQIFMGKIIRGVHHWAANLMVLTVFLHMLRVYIYGAFKKPRELNWITGVILFVLVMSFGFTGYLLPWDQKAYWATKVGTEMPRTVPFVGDYIVRFLRGGTIIGALTLSRFYALHVIFLPSIIAVLLIGHFAMVRSQGIAEPL